MGCLEWSYHGHHGSLSNRTRGWVSISTMNHFDRFLDLHEKDGPSSCSYPFCQHAVDSHTFQLAAMTSLYVVIEVHDAESCCHDSHRVMKDNRYNENTPGQD